MTRYRTRYVYQAAADKEMWDSADKLAEERKVPISTLVSKALATYLAAQ